MANNNLTAKERGVLLKLVKAAIDDTFMWDRQKQAFVTIPGKEDRQKELLAISRKLEESEAAQ